MDIIVLNSVQLNNVGFFLKRESSVNKEWNLLIHIIISIVQEILFYYFVICMHLFMVFIGFLAEHDHLELESCTLKCQKETHLSGLYLLSANEHFALDFIRQVTFCWQIKVTGYNCRCWTNCSCRNCQWKRSWHMKNWYMQFRY